MKRPLSFSSVVRTLWAYTFSALFLVIWAPPFFILMLLPESWRRDNRLLFWMLHVFYTAALWATRLRVTYYGSAKNIRVPVIFAANHQSSLDIPLVGGIVGKRPHMWFVLSWYIKYPLLGRFIRTMGIPVEQDGAGKAAQAMRQAVRLLKGTNRHIIIFPEGGRHTDGAIHAFKSGVGLLARHTERPVVPIYIKGVNQAYPPASFWLYDDPITVVIGPLFYSEQDESDEQFTARLREWFIDQAASSP